MGDKTLCQLMYGKGAHVDPLACLEGIPAELAARRAAGSPHSIWQLVLHMNYWMDYDFRTIAGEAPPYPEHAMESWPAHPEPTDEKQWKLATGRFGHLLARLAALSDADGSEFERMIVKAEPRDSNRKCTVHTALWEIAVHNSYHVGQIALLRRQAGAWPPERGSDTW